MIPIPIDVSDATKRTWVLQLIRSGAQWIAGYVASLGVVLAAIAALSAAGIGVDAETFTGALRTVIEVLTFLTYIAAVGFLERNVHPWFGWLNGWRAQLDYQRPDVIEVTSRPIDLGGRHDR